MKRGAKSGDGSEVPEIRLLGGLSIWRLGKPLALPPSRKTRAMFAYLVLSAREHARERLCEMFWDVTDDPRGALRWSLSRLRPLVDDEGARRIVADRDAVAFVAAGARIDLVSLRESVAAGLDRVDIGQLGALAERLRGELLAGLDLPDFHEFQAWLVAEREQARRLRAQVLSAAVARLDDDPEAALPYARTRAQLDPTDERTTAELLALLGRVGRRDEAEHHYRAAHRLRHDLELPPSEALEQAWERVRRATIGPPPAAPPLPAPRPPEGPLVGRERERGELTRILDEVADQRALRVLVLSGEPGAGKSRLLTALADEVERRRGTVLRATSYEVERGRAYGSWIDALRQVPAWSIGDAVGSQLAPLVPELARATEAGSSRERMFGAVVDLVAARASTAPPVLLCFDDVQWLDAASAALLFFVCRMCTHRPVLVAIVARRGELLDNARTVEMMRALRREQKLDELAVEPLDRAGTAALVRSVDSTLDAEAIFVASGGNPLYALELLRAGGRDAPGTLADLIRDRVGRLSLDAREVLSWCALLGHGFRAALLSALAPIAEERLLGSLGELERHGFLRQGGTAGEYAFGHDVVRSIVDGDLSDPRRRLMHARIARLLVERLRADDAVAPELAHHAERAGDAALAARACIEAGRRALRIFANDEAEALARRGLRHAEPVSEPDRTRLRIELAELRHRARPPDDRTRAAAELDTLAYRALDQGSLEHARLGFHLLSHVRWEDGHVTEARASALKAELVSRAGDDRARSRALAEAGRCLAMLERDLPQAEALALEAEALGQRSGHEPFAAPAALGLVALHRGDVDAASELFERARLIARVEQDGLAEFHALEHLVTIGLTGGRDDGSCAQAEELERLAARLRAGSELPFARALAALCGCRAGRPEAWSKVEDAIVDLEHADAKHRLAFASTRAALAHLDHGDAGRARTHAERGLARATQVGRPSEIMLARVALARAARALDEDNALGEQLAILRAADLAALSRETRDAAQQLLATLAEG